MNNRWEKVYMHNKNKEQKTAASWPESAMQNRIKCVFLTGIWKNSMHPSLHSVCAGTCTGWSESWTVVSEQPLKISSLLFMPDCILGILVHSRGLCDATHNIYQTEYLIFRFSGLFHSHWCSWEGLTNREVWKKNLKKWSFGLTSCFFSPQSGDDVVDNFTKKVQFQSLFKYHKLWCQVKYFWNPHVGCHSWEKRRKIQINTSFNTHWHFLFLNDLLVDPA